jgi:hypothetical protein
MKFQDLPPVGQPLESGIFAGLTTTREGTHCAVVLLADKPDKGMKWKAAMDWAKKLGAELPTRPVGEMWNTRCRADPVAYLHTVRVVSPHANHNEIDQALSFSPKYFPLGATGMFESIGVRPLVFGDGEARDE